MVFKVKKFGDRYFISPLHKRYYGTLSTIKRVANELLSLPSQTVINLPIFCYIINVNIKN